MNEQKTWDEILVLQKEYKENLSNRELEKALRVNHMIYERLFDIYMTADERFDIEFFTNLSNLSKNFLENKLENLAEDAEKLKWHIQLNPEEGK